MEMGHLYNVIRTISCESPEQWIWDQYVCLENEKFSRKWLQEKYVQQNHPHADRAAFKNVQAFTAYISQAKAIFTTYSQNSFWVQPLLLYYGMISLWKALILTFDTDYPQNSSVLRHGLSTRKRKKENYQFFQDEIRVQSNGLFPFIAHRLQPALQPGQSYTPQELFSMVPELQSSYQSLFSTPSLLPVTLKTAQTNRVDNQGTAFDLSDQVLDIWHLTAPAFVHKLNRSCHQSFFSLDASHSRQGTLSLIWKHEQISHVNKWGKGFAHPWFYEDHKGNYYLWLGSHRPQQPLQEIFALHMLLFSLSMLCRYETPLWGEMTDTSLTEAAILIQQLLPLVKRKFPHLILQAIREEKLILRVE
jgi:hypothetical protein